MITGKTEPKIEAKNFKASFLKSLRMDNYNRVATENDYNCNSKEIAMQLQCSIEYFVIAFVST
eukprot:150219-Amphidinium_carterae.1